MAFETSRSFVGTPVLSAGQAPFYRNGLKRALDLTLVLLAAVPALILIAISAFLVALDGHNPFYIQRRVGRSGRIYRMVKLRTMHPDADAQLARYLEDNIEARAEWDEMQKLTHDPRITGVGHFLRKSSLDELPQLWNVLTGAMSIVGPRPMMENQEDLYPGLDYYDLRPGITGYWQISDRNECSFAQRAQFDTLYAREMSLLTDLTVIARTVGVVARMTGR